MNQDLKNIRLAALYSDVKDLKNSIIKENLTLLAEQEKTTIPLLVEAITHVLAGLPQTAKNMHANTVAQLLAGVEQLSVKLPQTASSPKKQNTIRILANAAVTRDDLTNQSLPNHSTTLIAQYGAQFPEIVDKYKSIVQDDTKLAKEAGRLKYSIQRAFNS